MQNKHLLIAGTLLCSIVPGLTSLVPDTQAVGFDNGVAGSSYFDLNAQACVVDNYNAATSSSVTSITDVDFSKITTLDCSNRDIANFRGIVVLTELESLNLSGNPNLATQELNFSFTKLKSLNISGVLNTYLDVSGAPDLEVLTADRSLYLKTADYAKKLNTGSYSIDLSNLKFLDAGSKREFTFEDKDKVEYTVPVTIDGRAHQVSTRGGSVSYAIYLNGDTEAETHNPIYINNNCQKNSDGVSYLCNNAVYYGDTINTDETIENVLSKIFNLSGYSLSQVKIVPPTANVELAVNEDNKKEGKILADAYFTLEFYFDLNGTVGVPDTGDHTVDQNQGAAVAVYAITAMATTSGLVYLLSYLSKRLQNRVKFIRK